MSKELVQQQASYIKAVKAYLHVADCHDLRKKLTLRIYFLVLVQPKGDRLKAALSCSDTEGKPV